MKSSDRKTTNSSGWTTTPDPTDAANEEKETNIFEQADASSSIPLEQLTNLIRFFIERYQSQIPKSDKLSAIQEILIAENRSGNQAMGSMPVLNSTEVRPGIHSIVMKNAIKITEDSPADDVFFDLILQAAKKPGFNHKDYRDFRADLEDLADKLDLLQQEKNKVDAKKTSMDQASPEHADQEREYKDSPSQATSQSSAAPTEGKRSNTPLPPLASAIYTDSGVVLSPEAPAATQSSTVTATQPLSATATQLSFGEDTGKEEKKATPPAELTSGISDQIQAQAFEIERTRAYDINAALQAEFKQVNLDTITDQEIAQTLRRMPQFRNADSYEQQIDAPLRTEIEFRGDARDLKDDAPVTKSAIDAIRDTTNAMLSKRQTNLKVNKEKRAELIKLSEALIDTLPSTPSPASISAPSSTPSTDLVQLMALITKVVSDTLEKKKSDQKIRSEFQQLSSRVQATLQEVGPNPDIEGAKKILPLLEEYRKKIQTIVPSLYKSLDASIYELERPARRAVILAEVEPELQRRLHAREEKKGQPQIPSTEFKSRNRERTEATKKYLDALEDFNQDIATVQPKIKRRKLDEKDQPVDLEWIKQLQANISRADFEIGQISTLTETYANSLEKSKPPQPEIALELRRLSNELIKNLESPLISDQQKLTSLREYQKYLFGIKKSETQQLIDIEKTLLARINSVPAVREYINLNKKWESKIGRSLPFIDRRTKYYQQLMDSRERIVRELINILKEEAKGTDDERADKIIAKMPALQMEDPNEAAEVRTRLIAYLKNPHPKAKFDHPYLTKVPVELFALHVSMPDRHFTPAPAMNAQQQILIEPEAAARSGTPAGSAEKSKLVSRRASFSTTRSSMSGSSMTRSLSAKQLGKLAEAEAELKKLAIRDEYKAFREGLVIGATIDATEHNTVKNNYNLSETKSSFQDGIEKAKSIAIAKAKTIAPAKEKSELDEKTISSKTTKPIPLLLPERRITAEEVKQHFKENPAAPLSDREPKVFSDAEFKQHFEEYRRAKIVAKIIKNNGSELEKIKNELFSKKFGLTNPDSLPSSDEEKHKAAKTAAKNALQDAIRQLEGNNPPENSRLIKEAEDLLVKRHATEIEPELKKAMQPVETYERTQQALARKALSQSTQSVHFAEETSRPDIKEAFTSRTTPPTLGRAQSTPTGSTQGSPILQAPGTPGLPKGSPSVKLKASRDEEEMEKKRRMTMTAAPAPKTKSSPTGVFSLPRANSVTKISISPEPRARTESPDLSQAAPHAQSASLPQGPRETLALEAGTFISAPRQRKRAKRGEEGNTASINKGLQSPSAQPGSPLLQQSTESLPAVSPSLQQPATSLPGSPQRSPHLLKIQERQEARRRTLKIPDTKTATGSVDLTERFRKKKKNKAEDKDHAHASGSALFKDKDKEKERVKAREDAESISSYRPSSGGKRD